METAIPVVALLLAIAFFGARIDNFYSVSNLANTLRQASELGFIALGLSLVLFVGGIDLSVGSLFALCNIVALYLIQVLDRTSVGEGKTVSVRLDLAGRRIINTTIIDTTRNYSCQ